MKDIIKKKRVLFPLIFFGEIIIIAVIAKIFDLETSNSPLGIIYAYIMDFTLIGFLIKIRKDYKSTIAKMEMPARLIVLGWFYFLMFILITVMVLFTIQTLYNLLAV